MKMRRKLALLMAIVLAMSLVPLNLAAAMATNQGSVEEVTFYGSDGLVYGDFLEVVPMPMSMARGVSVSTATPTALRLYAFYTDANNLRRMRPVNGMERPLSSTLGIVALAIDENGNYTGGNSSVGSTFIQNDDGRLIEIPVLPYIEEWNISATASGDSLGRWNSGVGFGFSHQSQLSIGPNTTARTLAITASAGELTTTANVRVNTAQRATVARISVGIRVGTLGTLAPGARVPLWANADDQAGVPMNNIHFAWSVTSNPAANDSIGQDEDGNPVLVVGSSTTPREITVTAAYGGVSASSTVTVDPTWPLITVGTQTGVLRAFLPGEVTFQVTAANMPEGQEAVIWLPQGLSVRGWTESSPSNWEGEIANGTSTLTIVSDGRLGASSLGQLIVIVGHENQTRWAESWFNITVTPSPQHLQLTRAGFTLQQDTVTVRAPGSGALQLSADVFDQNWADMPNEAITWAVDYGSVTGVTHTSSGRDFTLNVGANATAGTISITAASALRPTISFTTTVVIDPEFVREPSWIDLTPTPWHSVFLPGDSTSIQAVVRDRNNEPMTGFPIVWEMRTSFDNWDTFATSNVDTFTSSGLNASFTASTDARERIVWIRARLANSETWIGGVTFGVNPSAPVIRVGNQQHALTAGVAGRATFNATIHNLPPETYRMEISNLPAGVTVYGWENLGTFAIGDVTFGQNRTASIHLVTDNTTSVLTEDLWIGLDTGGWWTSEQLTLTISQPQGAPPPTNQPPWWSPAPPPWWTPPPGATSTPGTTAGGTASTISVNGVNVTARRSGSNATLVLPANTVTNLINNASTVINFDLSRLSNTTTVIMPVDAASSFAGANLAVEIALPHATISLDNAALQGIVSQANGASVQFTVQPMEISQVPSTALSALPAGSNVFRIQVSSGGQNIANLGGQMSTSVRFATPAVAWRINPNGQLEQVPSEFNAQTGTITFTKNSLSLFAVGSDPRHTPTHGFLGATGYAMRLSIGSVVFTRMGEIVQNDVAPFIDPAYNRAMVPLRVIAEGMGASVTFDDNIRTVFIRKNGQEAHLTIDQPLSGGMGTPVIQNDRTFVPLRYVSEILGATVRWNEETRAVYIYQ